MSELIGMTYGEFFILYSELDNTWIPKRSNGSLPGCSSLAKAKESIDKLLKQEKSTFIRHQALFLKNPYSDPVRVEVTSFVVKEQGYSRKEPRLYTWIKLPDGQRQCENVETLREFTAENVERLSRAEGLKKEVERIRQQLNLVREAFTPYVLKPAKEIYSSKEVPADVGAFLPKSK